jgi:putative transposase
MQSQSLREVKGQSIAQTEGSIKRIDEGEYQVKSQSGNGFYQVLSTEYGWACSCPDNQYRGIDCKHILGVRISLALRKKVEASVVIQPINAQNCPKCNSESIKRKGVRHNVSGNIQKFQCRECGHFFTINLGFAKMHATPQIITSAMQLYFTGESLRNVQKFLRLQGVEVSHVTILNWIRKYIAIMEKYLDKIVPQVSDKWRADELYVKFSGNMKYVFVVMDDQTRFWIAQEVAHWKEDHDTKKLFRAAQETAQKSPVELVTDGLKSYHSAYLEVFAPTGTVHTKEIQIAGQVHNNKMERMNGEVRDREKTMRGLKNMDTPILKGAQIYHNYVRPHEGLHGKTPADAAGIEVQGVNKWLTIIQNASKK